MAPAPSCSPSARPKKRRNRPDDPAAATEAAVLARQAFVPYMFAMSDSRHVVDVPELEKLLRIWFSVLAQRRASLLRDLWTRRGEEYDGRNNNARHELARYLAEKILCSHELTRAPHSMDVVEAENRIGRGHGRQAGLMWAISIPSAAP